MQFLVLVTYFCCFANIVFSNNFLTDTNFTETYNKLTNIFNKYYDTKYSQSSIVFAVENVDDELSTKFLKYIHKTQRIKIIVLNMYPICRFKSEFKVNHFNLCVLIINHNKIHNFCWVYCFKVYREKYLNFIKCVEKSASN